VFFTGRVRLNDSFAPITKRKEDVNVGRTQTSNDRRYSPRKKKKNPRKLTAVGKSIKTWLGRRRMGPVGDPEKGQLHGTLDNTRKKEKKKTRGHAPCLGRKNERAHQLTT